MWIFGKDRAAFPYEVDATTDEAAGEWVLRSCKHTKTGAVFSAWVLSSNCGGIERARAAVKRMKTLRHPNFITYVDSHEAGDTLTLITEPAIPLKTYLQRNADSSNLTYLTSWGIYQVTKALDFFNKDCKLQHNNVRLASVFVTPAGDWKLGGLEFVQAVGTPPDTAPADKDVYWPSDKRRVDSWGLGCLIWEVYNATPLRSADQLRQLSAIPQALVPNYSELLHPKPPRRSSISEFLSRASASNGFFDNFYVRSLLFLEEIQIKDKDEKLVFLSGLADDVTAFPDDVAKYKLLPHLMHFLQYGGAGAEVLTPLLRLGKLLDTAEFEQKVLPCLVKLFSSPDRATRVRLLQQLPNFIDNLPDKCVNDQIFQPVCQGFSDTNPLVREATIRAMIPLAAKLSDRTVNEALPRHLTQLQVKDEQGGIRANATICLAKLAGRMSPRIRQGPLLNALLKCTRDPYPPARRMAVTALATTLPFYTLKDSAGKVVPCLAFLTIDPEREVRDDTFRALSAAISRLEKASVDPEVAEREDRVANSGGARDGPTGVVAASAASAGTAALAWTNWAVTALSSKFMKGGAANATAPPASTAAVSNAATKKEEEEDEEEAETRAVADAKEKGLGEVGGVGRIKSRVDDFVPDASQRPASAYNWDGARNAQASGWDDFDLDAEDDDGWESLEAPRSAPAGGKNSRASPMTSGETSGSSEAPRKPSQPFSVKSDSGTRSGLATRGAMKLGKKVSGESAGIKEFKQPKRKDSWGSGHGKEEGAEALETKKEVKESGDWGLKADSKKSWDSWGGGAKDSGVAKTKKGTKDTGGWDAWGGDSKEVGNDRSSGSAKAEQEDTGGWDAWGADAKDSRSDWNSTSVKTKREAKGTGGWDSWGAGSYDSGSDWSSTSAKTKREAKGAGGWDSSATRTPIRKGCKESDDWDAW